MDINLPYRTVENIKTLGSLKGFLRTCDIKYTMRVSAFGWCGKMSTQTGSGSQANVMMLLSLLGLTHLYFPAAPL